MMRNDCCGHCPDRDEYDCLCHGNRCGACGGCQCCCYCDLFTCGDCGARRYNPPAGSTDYDYDEGQWREAGDPLCEDCARKRLSCPEYARHITDGGPVPLLDARTLAETAGLFVGLALLIGGGLCL